MMWVRTDVVIVGGGPVGLLLAAELAVHGVRTLVLEERADVSERPKATTLHARTGQALARGGYLPAPSLPLDEGVVSTPFHFAGMWGLELTAPATEPEPLFKGPQADLERLFEERVLAAGARILRRHRVIGLDRRETGVTVTAEHSGGRTAFEAAYVVGADGARSAVRAYSGIASDASPPTVAAMAGNVRCDGAEAPEPGWHRTPRGWVVAKRTSEGRMHLRAVDCSKAHADHTLPLGLEEFRSETSRILGREIGMGEPRWLSRFSDFSRVARSYRSGRVLLAGDAAHVHFPIGGQGLSTGLLDALNLGWKLALSVQGAANRGLLDTYETERRPAAVRVVDTVRTQVELMLPENAPDSLEELPEKAGAVDPGAELTRLAVLISGQEINPPFHAVDPARWRGRFLQNLALMTTSGPIDLIRLLRDRRMVLVRFGEGAAGRSLRRGHVPREVVRTVWAEPVAELPCAELLLRPDGHVAWASEHRAQVEDLARVLSGWLAPTTARAQAEASASAALSACSAASA
ncbi:FAD-dependent monooxygenase [Streptomyces sp. NPDC005963]|uniref:FAD-dependent monooxygenase n=1 Tax=Streptomyces sp. NPDC005963 TaxID=3156721 RepID=UPI0033D49630